MCLILFAYKSHPRYPLVLAANRDEFYHRPAAPLDYWPDHPSVLAGRDLEHKGTWMGITRTGRTAAVTNYRDAHPARPNAPSRGHLVTGFLETPLSTKDYLSQIQDRGDQYNGFNLIAGHHDHLMYFSNRSGAAERLHPGFYGLSNHLLNADWPKVRKGKKRLAALIEGSDGIDPDSLLDLLQDQWVPPDDQLPHTGVGIEWERTLAPIFITSPTYGTRCSSVLLIESSGRVLFCERSWLPAKSTPRAAMTRCFRFTIDGSVKSPISALRLHPF